MSLILDHKVALGPQYEGGMPWTEGCAIIPISLRPQHPQTAGDSCVTLSGSLALFGSQPPHSSESLLRKAGCGVIVALEHRSAASSARVGYLSTSAPYQWRACTPRRAALRTRWFRVQKGCSPHPRKSLCWAPAMSSLPPDRTTSELSEVEKGSQLSPDLSTTALGHL